MTKVGPAERKRIVAALHAGKTPYRVAKESGRSRPTVSKIAREAGIDINVNATKKAAAAKRDYGQAERLGLLNEAFDKARELLQTVNTPHKLQAWMVAVGIAVDKRRLEDGEATSRGEHTHREAISKSLEEYFRELDALAANDGEPDPEKSVHTTGADA